MKLIDTIKVHNELGEGIIWDHARQLAWWTDILQKKLYQYDPLTKTLHEWDTPERLCCFAPVKDNEKLICAFESGFAFYEPRTGEIDWVSRLEQDNPGTRFNDGRTDRQGRLWAGTMVEDKDKATYKGSLYCLHADLTVSKTISGLSITNSLCWSPDGTTLYHTDTPTRTIMKYPFDTTTGAIGEGTTLVETGTGCYPDGSIVDSEGCLWNAQWGASKVVRYTPAGKVDREVNLPMSQPTCVAFGGENLNLLFITSAWSELSESNKRNQPDAGNVLVFQTDITGLKEESFIEQVKNAVSYGR